MPNRDVPDAPFTAATAACSGWTPAARRHAVRTGRWDQLQLGVYDTAALPEPRSYQRAISANLRAARGAATACDRASLSHASAALAWNLPVLGRAVEQPCVTVQSGAALRTLAKVHLHRATLDEIAHVNGFDTTPVARTVADVAREHGVLCGVAAADAALHAGLTTERELLSTVRRQGRWPGVRRAREAVAFADRRAESPLESASRFRVHQHKLPVPWLQARICDQWGVIVARCDFYWEEYGVVGEADGAMKWENDPAERDRRDAKTYLLEELGLIVVRWGWSDIYRFDRVARRLRLGYERGAPPGSAQRRWRAQP